MRFEVYAAKHKKAQARLDTLAATLEQAEPDAVIVVVDDQDELFARSSIPTIGVVISESVWDLPRTGDHSNRLSEGTRRARWASHSEIPYKHHVDSLFAYHLADQLTDDNFDVMSIAHQPMTDRSVTRSTSSDTGSA